MKAYASDPQMVIATALQESTGAAARTLAERGDADHGDVRHDLHRGNVGGILVERPDQQAGQEREHHLRGEPHAGHQQEDLQQVLEVSAGEEPEQRRPLRFPVPRELLDAYLGNPRVVDQVADAEQDTEEERKPPAPGLVRGRRDLLQRGELDDADEDDGDRRAGGHYAVGETAQPRQAALDRQRCRPGVAAAEEHAVDEPEHDKRRKGAVSPLVVAEQAGHRECGDREADAADHRYLLAADLVA